MRNALLLALGFAAGYSDAFAYLALGRVFTANMTGNTVLLGVALAHGGGEEALRGAVALAGFVAGAALAACIVENDTSPGRWPACVTRALALEVVVLAAFALGWALRAPTTGLIALSALAMGAQSAAVHRLELSGISTTYLTGTLTHLVARLAGRERRGALPLLAQPRLLAAVWAIYLGGAAVAALARAGVPDLAPVVPAALVAAVVAAASLAAPR